MRSCCAAFIFSPFVFSPRKKNTTAYTHPDSTSNQDARRKAICNSAMRG
jgi:hypothetical protein